MSSAGPGHAGSEHPEADSSCTGRNNEGARGWAGGGGLFAGHSGRRGGRPCSSRGLRCQYLTRLKAPVTEKPGVAPAAGSVCSVSRRIGKGGQAESYYKGQAAEGEAAAPAAEDCWDRRGDGRLQPKRAKETRGCARGHQPCAVSERRGQAG